MAGADRVYADPSALLKLYLLEPESRAMTAWRARIGGSLLVTLHGRLEITNALGLARHRGLISERARVAALQALDQDFDEGRYQLADLLWRATLQRASELNRAHAPALGCRSLDVIHVASAIELGRKSFLTFDVRQRQLARAAGLKVLSLQRATA